MDGKNTEKRSTSKGFFVCALLHLSCRRWDFEKSALPCEVQIYHKTEVNLLLEQYPKEIIQKR